MVMVLKSGKRQLSSHIYFCLLFTLLSFSLLPMVASFAAVLSGRSALYDIAQHPDRFYGQQLAKVSIYAAYLSAILWFFLIMMFVASNLKQVV